MKLGGLYELQRHFQREHHLRANQTFRARYHPSTVPESAGRTLYCSKLEPKKELFMHLTVPELDQNRPFYYDVIERKAFNFRLASSRNLIQIEILLVFPKKGGELWPLDKNWTQVGVLTSHCDDLNLSARYISVSGSSSLIW